jgi:hypothetical protein
VIAFADSSAMVTRYTPRERDILPTDGNFVVSDVARVEVVSALWRQSRHGMFDLVDAAMFVRDFEADWTGGRYAPVRLVPALLERAAAGVAVHGLRSLDAIQLACALAARAAEPECRAMVVLDERLRAAAASEGFDILPV